VKGPNFTAQTLLNDAAASVQENSPTNQAIYAQLMIFTPTAPYSSNQEFLQLSSASLVVGSKGFESIATPEPPAELLVGIGLIAIAWAARRRSARRRPILP